MNDDLTASVQNLYDRNPAAEWNRLERHRIEFAVTLKTLLASLPPAPALILDCGGGPGRYAIELARRGYLVTLFDLSGGNLQLARQKAGEAGVTLTGYEQGSATDLSRFTEDEFDAVLLLGPLYHLFEEADRLKALTEARRVLKPGATLFCSFIHRYAGHRDAAVKSPSGLFREADQYRFILETGRILPSASAQAEFVGYLAYPAEAEALIRSGGLEIDQILGVEGLVGLNEAGINQLGDTEFQAWVDLNYSLAADPSILGCVQHFLAVARNPLWKAVLLPVARRLVEAGITYRIVGGTSVALNGVPIKVNDIDIETSEQDAFRFQEIFSENAFQPPAWSEGGGYRSVFGRYDFQGVQIDIMGDLQRREGDRWIPTMTQTETRVDLEGFSLPVSWLEEETLAYIRRGRLDRAAQCLPYCSHERLLALIRGQVATNVI